MQTLAAQLLVMFQPVLIAALGWLAVQAALYIKAHTKNALLQGVLTRTNDTVWAVVTELEQTVVAALREAAKDGSVSDEELKKVKEMAMARAKAYLGAEGLALIIKVLGLETSTALDNWLSAKIESTVHTLKAGGPVPT